MGVMNCYKKYHNIITNIFVMISPRCMWWPEAPVRFTGVMNCNLKNNITKVLKPHAGGSGHGTSGCVAADGRGASRAQSHTLRGFIIHDTLM
jgi:hypothetical protein